MNYIPAFRSTGPLTWHGTHCRPTVSTSPQQSLHVHFKRLICCSVSTERWPLSWSVDRALYALTLYSLNNLLLNEIDN